MGNLTESNLIPLTTQLKTGQRCIRIGNHIVPVGVGGIQAGGGSSPGSSMDFYKCTYVSSDSSMTWSGRKAVLNDTLGYYEFQSDSTEGLSYSSIMPVIGSIYSQDALIRSDYMYIDTLQKELLFYAPLSKESSAASTGQQLTAHSKGAGISYQIYKNVPCVRLQGDSNIQVTSGYNSLPSGNDPFTISAWANLQTTGNYGQHIFGFGQSSNKNDAVLRFNGNYDSPSNGIGVWIYTNGFNASVYYTVGQWYHVCFTHDGTTGTLYVDGVARGTKNQALSLTQNYWFIGALQGQERPWHGYIAACRLYKRCLSAAQVFSLSKEFTPTA